MKPRGSELRDSARGLAAEFGRQLQSRQLVRLEMYREWLITEATDAGGIGPNEPAIVEQRHILDSLTYLAPISGTQPDSLLDLGSGVGLPGIPLAISLPDTVIRLVDRSGRRCHLMSRAVRILELDNIEIVNGEISGESPGPSIVTSRASLPPAGLLAHLRRIGPQMAVVGGSTRHRVEFSGYETREIVSRYLESPRWVLIMRKS